MAKRVYERTAALASWGDVDIALAEMARLTDRTDAVKAKRDQAIKTLRADAHFEMDADARRITELKHQIRAYLDEHWHELDGKKSKELEFGAVGYRRKTRIPTTRVPGKEQEQIQKLRELDMGDCIAVPPPRINRRTLHKYPPSKILEAGIDMQSSDEFFIRMAERPETEGS